MAGSDFDRTEGQFFLGFDDAGNNRLLLEKSIQGHIVRTQFDTALGADYIVQMAVFMQSETFQGVNIGARLIDLAGVTHGDGYWAGFEEGNGGTIMVPKIRKRVSGVLSDLATGIFFDHTVGDEFFFRLIVEGSAIQFFILRSTGEVISAMSAIDSTFATGKSGIGRFGGVENRVLVDFFRTLEVA